MTQKVILNASPLILLGRTGYLWLISKLFHKIIIPPVVFDEVIARKTPDALAMKRELDTGNINIEIPTSENVEKISRFCRKDMALGEIQVLALALDLQNQKERTLTILDDLPARRTAEVLGMPIIGTQGIIVQALRKRLIDRAEAKNIIYRLTEVGAYFDTELVQEVLRSIEFDKT